VSNRFVEMGLRSPVNLTWEMTQACNLKCRHCLSSSGHPGPDEMTTSEALSLVDQIHEARIFQINIGGGEPFMRPDFEEVLAACHKYGIMTCISTNGTLLTKDLIDRLAATRLVNIQVSIDGANRETCDAIRGQGTFDAAIEALKLLAPTTIATSMNTVLTAQNAAEIPALYEMSRSLGVSLRVSRFRPSGRGVDNWDDLRPNAAQLLAFSDWLSKSGDVRTGDSFFSLTSQERQGLGLNLCGACKLTCCVGPNGNVYPCAFLQSAPFKAGSLRENTFQEIWDNSEIFNSFRRLRIHSCEECRRFDQCHGGCPAVAWHLKNELSGGDPECLERCVTMIADEAKDSAAA
jgi:mycofactocin biosynthetic radical S-adenosylmethionine protein MftC